MSTASYAALPLNAPFPGLRAFDADESLLFYGRERHVADLLERLGDSRFVAVTGTSGSGKSSLVRAGLRPALQRGYLIDATTRWRFVTMRPGNAPLQAMADALVHACDTLSFADVYASLQTTSAGLSDVVSQTRLAPGESVLIIADQFEELFRFDTTPVQQSEGALFVSQLLEATERRVPPVYVVVTMRSEFLGRCSEFSGLAAAFNRSQYLVPRLTRDERRDAIERPLRLFGVQPAPALVEELLNDGGDDPDQLPVMQHVLLRAFREWERNGGTGRLERQHYAAVGRIERAIDSHGEELFLSANGRVDGIAERLFRSLTVMQGRVALRRPRSVAALYAICGASTRSEQQRVDTILIAFADRQSAFLALSSASLTPETVVDITHESVIRKWNRLKDWVQSESRSSEWYLDLARDVVRHRSGTTSLWQDPELSGILQRRRDEGWNEAWANQYRSAEDPTFAEVLAFLDESSVAQERQKREFEERRDRELRQARELVKAKRRQLIVVALLLGLAVIAAVIQYRSLAKDRQIAKAAAELQRVQSQVAEDRQRLDSVSSQLAILNEGVKARGGTATADEQAQIDKLKQDIKAKEDQLASSQNEASKLRKDQELSTSDRGQLLNKIDDLQRQLSVTFGERDKLRNQLANVPQPSTQPDDRATLSRQLNEERTRANDTAAENARLGNEIASLRESIAAPISVAGTADELSTVFGDGVRNYDQKQWDKAAVNMWIAIAIRPNVKQVPKDVRMAGTRFVPFAPASYLAAALSQSGAECSVVSAALKAAGSEPTPSDIQGVLQTARTKCGRK